MMRPVLRMIDGGKAGPRFPEPADPPGGPMIGLAVVGILVGSWCISVGFIAAAYAAAAAVGPL